MLWVRAALPSLLLAEGGGDSLSERPPCPHMHESLVGSSLKCTGLLVGFPLSTHLQNLLHSGVQQPRNEPALLLFWNGL